MGEPDGVSYELGMLTGDMKHVRDQVDKLVKAAEETRVEQMKVKLQLDDVKEDVTWMKPHVRHYSTVRGRAAWLGSTIIALSGTFGGALSGWLFRKFS